MNQTAISFDTFDFQTNYSELVWKAKKKKNFNQTKPGGVLVELEIEQHKVIKQQSQKCHFG